MAFSNAVIIFVILHASIESIYGQVSLCDPNRLRNCSEVVASTHFDFEELAIPRESIEKTCKPIRDGALCINDFFERCDTTGMEKSEFLNEGYKVLTDTCDMFEQKYLPYYECYAKLNAGYKVCLNDIEKISQDIGTVMNANDTQKKILCCEIQNVYECVLGPTEKECGAGAREGLRGLVDKQLPPFLHGLCEVYKDKCPKSDIVNEEENINGDKEDTNNVNKEMGHNDVNKDMSKKDGGGGANAVNTGFSLVLVLSLTILIQTFY